jgi:pimeloyl-ACP methyl ester carboxylesterase
MAMPELKLSQGQIHYRDEGTGPPLVLVHGLMVNGTVWGRLVPELAPEARCIVPDLPLGAHRQAMNSDADLSPEGVARLVAELTLRLDLDGVTLVGKDTGGAICQLVVASQPGRISAPLTLNRVPDDLVRGWVEPLGVPGVRRDLVRFCREVRPTVTLAAAERLAAAFPRARLERIENARTFVQIDAPQELARLILKEV